MNFTFSRSLREADRKNKEMEIKIKRSQNDVAKYRKELTEANDQNTKLLYVLLCKCKLCSQFVFHRQEVECHKQCESDRIYLKSKIKELEERQTLNSATQEQNTSIKRIITESPTPMLKMSQFKNLLDEAILNKVHSPTVVCNFKPNITKSFVQISQQERVQQIKASNSPYLNLKPTGVGLPIGKLSGSASAANKVSGVCFVLL